MTTTDQQVDIRFVGHLCYDEIFPFGADSYLQCGSAALCGAAVAVRLGLKTDVVTRMDPNDTKPAEKLLELGAKVHIVPSEHTTLAQVIHRSENMDERELLVLKDAGPFLPEDVPQQPGAKITHLAGISDHEFTLPFVQALAARGECLSMDMQALVRVLDERRRVCFSTPEQVEDFVACLHYVKLDIVEAEKITGTRDLAKAAKQFVAWGAQEVLITEQAGATLAVGDQILQAPFTNKNQSGRTGRGDTTMSAYLCRRLTHEPAEALRFAATLVSLKMEIPGPFVGTLAMVEERMAQESA